MMMKMLDAAGLELVTDHVRTADEDNPKGYFELEQVKELDKGGDKSWVAEHKGKVLKVISFLLPDLPDDCCYKTIFMRRDLHEVIASQNKMLVNRGEPTDSEKDARMIRLYGNHLRKTGIQLKGRLNFEVLDVDHRRVLDRPREEAVRVAQFLGEKLDTEAMAAVVDKNLYRNRREAKG
jgi:hypothetical protein